MTTSPWFLAGPRRFPPPQSPSRLTDAVVTFVAPCPEGHPAQWTEVREDCRMRLDVWCPVCEVGAHRLSAGAGGGPDGLEGRGGTLGHPGGNLRAQSVTDGDAA